MNGHKQMPFGKHKGKYLADIPADYFLWLIKNVRLDPGFELDVRIELRERQARANGQARNQSHARSDSRAIRLPQGVTIGHLLEIVINGRRALARKHHPDVGGDNRQMTVVNQAADFLEETLPVLLEVR